MQDSDGGRGQYRRRFLSALASAGIGGLLAGCSTERRNRRTTAQFTTESPETTTAPSPADPYFDVGPTVGVQEVATGLVSPNAFVLPSDGTERRFVVDQIGLIRVLDGETLREEPFLDLRDRLVAVGEGLPNWVSYDERGLLGLAFHPDFESNGRFYVRYSAPPDSEDLDHRERLSEFQVTEDGTRGDPDSERILLDLPWERPIHQAGTLEFGPEDGYLYAAIGDGLNPWNGQEITDNFKGSILRIDIDTRTDDRPYGIPEDNPRVGKEGLDEHYAWGLRNPWKMAFSGDMLTVGDVGQATWEEVNVIEKGGNYGWPFKEGTHCHDPATGTSGEECVATGYRDEELTDPVFEFPHFYQETAVGYAVIGGHVHTGPIDSLRDRYVCGVFTRSITEPAGRLLVATPSESTPWDVQLLQFDDRDELGIQVLSLGQGDDHETYVLGTTVAMADDPLSNQGGVIYRITPP